MPPERPAAPVELTVVVPCYNERDNVVPLVRRLETTLTGIAWEVVFVDDNSPDGTAAEARRLAAQDERVRCLRRVGRRGLASAVIEGVLSSSAAFVAVMDGDLQHDETRLPLMLALLKSECDLVVGSRHVQGGNSDGLSSPFRHFLSRTGISIAQSVLPVRLTDPMSGFFAMRRPLFENLAPKLTGRGFKILLDVVLAAPPGLRVQEVPFRFGERLAGESKLDALVLAQFLGMLLDKLTGNRLPLRFVAFALIGAVGVMVNVGVSLIGRHMGLEFRDAEIIGTICAMVVNFALNNGVTYRDQRLKGFKLLRGLVIFMIVCGLGAVANIGIATALYLNHAGWKPSGAAGAVVGVVWNYTMSSLLVWRARR